MKNMTGRKCGIRRLCLWMLVVILSVCVLGSGMAAFAERNGIPELAIQWAAVREGGNIEMLLYSRSNALKAIDLALSAGDIDLPIDNVEPYVGGTTWVILVDSANVNTSDGTEPIRATIKNLLESMRNEDNGVILSIPDALMGINLRSKAQLMSAEPPAIKKNTRERRLFEAIDRAMSFLETADGVYEHAVLTVITNGKKLYEAGVNSTNLIQRISNEPVTVYTVVYGTQRANDAPAMDILQRMAEFSCGGICVFDRPDAGDEGAARVVSAIRNNEAHFFRTLAHVPASGASGSNLMLRSASGGNEVDWALDESDQDRLAASEEEAPEAAEEDEDSEEGEDSEKAENPPEEGGENAPEGQDGEAEKPNEADDSVEIEKKRPEVTDAPTPTPTATPEVTEAPTATAEVTEAPTATVAVTESPTPTAEPTPVIGGIFKWPPTDWKGYLAYGLIALAVLALIILIIRKLTQKKAPEEETAQFSKTQPQTSPVDDKDIGYNRIDDRGKQRYNNDEIYVTLVDIDNPRNRYSAQMKHNELSIGRGGVDDKGRPVAIDLRIDTDDAKLSRKHVVFQMKDGRMMVNDCSTNGIFIGDSTRRIEMPTEIHQKSILRMGNARFMVTWTVENGSYTRASH